MQTATYVGSGHVQTKVSVCIVGPCRDNSSTRSRLASKQADWSLCLIGLDSWSATA